LPKLEAAQLPRILSGVYGTGDKLPTEAELGDDFGISRITVRQALGLLRDEGLVTSGGSRRAGTLTLPRNTDGAGSEAGVRAVAARDIVDIIEFRSVVEPAVARLAARRSDETLVARLRAAVESLGGAPDPTSFRRADSEFHLALAQACGNERLMEAVLVTRAELLHWRDLIPMPDDIEENRAEHERITAAVTDHDEEAAAAAMLDHLRLTLASFQAHIHVTGDS
ncbi:MAG: FCD domain-containing protein, partial [Chloroflexota bacterium]